MIWLLFACFLLVALSVVAQSHDLSREEEENERALEWKLRIERGYEQ